MLRGLDALCLQESIRALHLSIQFEQLKRVAISTFGIMGMSLSPHLGWKPIPKNPIPISSATAFTWWRVRIGDK